MDTRKRLNQTDKFFNTLYKHMTEKPIPMCAPSVTASIGDGYKKWYYKNPVFIDAPTGTGKTTFVYKKLIPYAIKNGHHLLLVSNRIALSLQQKQKIVSIVNELSPGSISITPEDLREVDLSKIYLFGPICVATYQSLTMLLNSTDASTQIPWEWFCNLKFTVFDEIHFGFSDALFNDICGSLIEKLPIVFGTMIRVYMTATSWEIKDRVLAAERTARSKREFYPLGHIEKCISQIPPKVSQNYTIVPSLLYYHKNAEYTSYRLHFFGNDDTLATCVKTEFSKGITKKDYLHTLASLIADTTEKNSSNKWAVFIDKRNSGTALKKLLAEKKISSAYFDAGIKQPPSAWTSLIEKSKINQSVLIATSVVDCGLNIFDPQIKNIAIFCTDRTAFIQLLGRKRLAPDEIIDLWVWVPDQDYFKHLAQKIISDLSLARKLTSCKSNYKKDPLSYARIVKWIWANKSKLNYPTLFYIDNNGLLSVDFYVKQVLFNRLSFVLQFTRENNPISFQHQIEEWLGIKVSDSGADPLHQKTVAYDAKRVAHIRKLQNDLTKDIGKAFTEKGFKTMQGRIIETAKLYASIKYQKKKQHSPSAIKLNECLEALDIPLTVKKAARTWTIHRIEEQQ